MSSAISLPRSSRRKAPPPWPRPPPAVPETDAWSSLIRTSPSVIFLEIQVRISSVISQMERSRSWRSTKATRTRPLLTPLPPPTMTMYVFTSGTSARYCSTIVATASVRSMLASVGIWICTLKPLSSVRGMYSRPIHFSGTMAMKKRKATVTPAKSFFLCAKLQVSASP